MSGSNVRQPGQDIARKLARPTSCFIAFSAIGRSSMGGTLGVPTRGVHDRRGRFMQPAVMP